VGAPRRRSSPLADDLRAVVTGGVRDDDGARALYATDASNHRALPIAVATPASVDEVVAAREVAERHGVPVLARGGGTSLAGQTCNEAVVLDLSRHLDRVVELDAERRIARVEPGVVLDDLREAAAAHGLTFGPDPATHDRCTLGGMIGNNSCGVHSVMAGRTADNVEELEVVTGDGLRLRVGATPEDELERRIAAGGREGEIYRRLRDLRDRYAPLIRERFPDIPRRVSGYALEQLLPEHGCNVARALVGSEGTCVLVLEATVRLVPSPPRRSLLVLGYPDVADAADDVPSIMAAAPVGLEGIDSLLVDYMRRKSLHTGHLDVLPDGGGWLLVEIGGDDQADAEGRARELMDRLSARDDPPSMSLFDDPADTERVWEIRESGLGATARVPGEADTWPGWEDAAVAPERLGDYLRSFRTLLGEHGYRASMYGHFGQGCVHARIDFDLVTPTGIDRFRRFLDDASDLVVSCGGSLSGEHGDGEARGALLQKMYGDELLEAFREFRRIWDPDDRLNPGKIVDAPDPTEHLRLGADYDPPLRSTWFRFPNDDGDMSRATQRCVGVGLCRRTDHGIMCPSYMVTKDEQHSTRGRAHLLFEMLSGRGDLKGWRDPHVKEALDLCLSCKGCVSDCPVDVDMATYKAEFLAHHYRGRIRPATAYSIGLIMHTARLASRAPQLVNAASSAPVVGRLLKRAGGIAPQRDLPRFAGETLTSWFRRRERPAADGERVVLWPDTFTDRFEPEIGKAAVEVLESLGFRVSLPDRWVCCGRPLYDFGFLRHARRLLRRTLRLLADDIHAGVPVVGLEPSCVAVFRDELGNLLPHDRDAQRLASQTFTLSELLERYRPDLEPPQVGRPAMVQGHCHHRAVLDFDAEGAAMRRWGIEAEVLDSGCCGMAGSFGFEREKYDVSVACGERVLLPAVREAEPDALLIADGFSCRQQIQQGTGRSALHLAQVLRGALRHEREAP
jgi:FAD/FMN-containing dehydrogenase/Fe-S oxidoreductase